MVAVSASPRTLRLVHAQARGAALVARLRRQRPLFLCVVAHTDTLAIPGLSAAGATPALRHLTAAADAEALQLGRARCLPGVPRNPEGPVGPVVITYAALQLADIPCLVVDAGLGHRPAAPVISLGSAPGRSILGGHALDDAHGLFHAGRVLGHQLAAAAPYLVVGESVPAGTTTALALMLALGLPAAGRVSSSFARAPHDLKLRVAQRALARSGLSLPAGDPLAAAEAVGDPMQPVVAGIAYAALARVPVVLAGGTMMVAVAALLDRLLWREGRRLDQLPLAIATTPWVVEDPQADFVGLLATVGEVPALVAPLDFAASRHAALRGYESFLVKEGVGAGGAAVAAALATGAEAPELLAAIERHYELVAAEAGWG